MHVSSYQKMETFVRQYVEPRYQHKDMAVLDVGSYDVNGTYKPLFTKTGWTYAGLDVNSGENVDLVVHDYYQWENLAAESFDVVISGQTFEHIEYFWLTMVEIVRILKPGGLCCIIAPSNGLEHQFPVDCWRFYPDGFHALARYANLTALEVSTEFEPPSYGDGSELWKDSLLIAQKPEN